MGPDPSDRQFMRRLSGSRNLVCLLTQERFCCWADDPQKMPPVFQSPECTQLLCLQIGIDHPFFCLLFFAHQMDGGRKRALRPDLTALVPDGGKVRQSFSRLPLGQTQFPVTQKP